MSAGCRAGSSYRSICARLTTGPISRVRTSVSGSDEAIETYMNAKNDEELLGLAVSARLIDGMDGTIRAGNTESGALFTIMLPAVGKQTETVAT
jgi:hypothetical protein